MSAWASHDYTGGHGTLHAFRRHTAFALALCCSLGVSTAEAQQKLLTLDDIYDPQKRVNFSGAPPPA